jgi:nodulation protein E
VPRIMPNAPASHLSMEFGLRGPCFSTASACASSAHAIGLAFLMIRAGMLDMAVSGGSDASIVVGFMKAWDALRVLSPDVCRPFSRDRTGLVIGEGAAILVLEEWEHATRRDATIHAELSGFGMSADAGELTAPSADGAARAMRAALDDAGMTPEQVDYVNAHGTGTRLNDKTEVEALGQVFGEHLHRLPVSSTKSMVGHCLNAGGAVELAVSALALHHGVLPPTIGFREPDPECAVDCVPNEARRAPIRVAMSNSFAFGGLNAVLLLRRAA